MAGRLRFPRNTVKGCGRVSMRWTAGGRPTICPRLVVGYARDPARSEWIQVDLQAAYLVDRVVLGPRASLWTESFYFPLCYRIETSLDGKDWQTVVRVEDSPRPGMPRPHVFTPTAARRAVVRRKTAV